MDSKYSILRADTGEVLEVGNFKSCSPEKGERFMDGSTIYEITEVDHATRKVWVKSEELKS